VKRSRTNTVNRPGRCTGFMLVTNVTNTHRPRHVVCSNSPPASPTHRPRHVVCSNSPPASPLRVRRALNSLWICGREMPTAGGRLETSWSSATTEALERNRRAKQRCWCRGPRRLTTFLARATGNVTPPCWHRRDTYSLCLLSETNVVRRLALSLVQWEYPFTCCHNIHK